MKQSCTEDNFVIYLFRRKIILNLAECNAFVIQAVSQT